MIAKSHEPQDLAETLQIYHEVVGGYLDTEDWLNREGNIALTNGKGSFALFDLNPDGVYTGHYFFLTERGRAALSLSIEMLDYLFANYPVNLIRGLTPVENKAARWMSRKTGFTSYGIVETEPDEFCELFILTKSEWLDKRKREWVK